MCFGMNPFAPGHRTNPSYSARITELKKAGAACLDLERISPPQGQLIALYPAKALSPHGQ